MITLSRTLGTSPDNIAIEDHAGMVPVVRETLAHDGNPDRVDA